MKKTFLTIAIIAFLLCAKGESLMEKETRKAGDRIRKNFYHAWKTGDWKPFLNDVDRKNFLFQFPAGEFGGIFKGKEAVKKMQRFAEVNMAHKNRVSSYKINFILVEKNLYSFTDSFEGVIGGYKIRGGNAFFFKIKNGKLIEFREFFRLL